MKVIIDIDERAYNGCLKLKSNDDMGVLGFHLINATANGTLLSDNVTNGNVIKALFPNIETFEPNKYEIAIKQNLGWLAFKKDWWNTPYKENSNEREILIRLEDGLYEQCKTTELQEKNEGFDFHIIKSVANGTVLPKGHGDLIDRDELVYDCSLGGGGCDHICRCDGCSYNIIRETTINKATPIIKADKGE